MTDTMIEETDAEATFEEEITRLEAIVRELEAGDLPLETAFARFEEGVRLSRSCRTRLDGIEARVAELLDDGETRTITPDDADA